MIKVASSGAEQISTVNGIKSNKVAFSHLPPAWISQKNIHNIILYEPLNLNLQLQVQLLEFSIRVVKYKDLLILLLTAELCFTVHNGDFLAVQFFFLWCFHIKLYHQVHADIRAQYGNVVNVHHQSLKITRLSYLAAFHFMSSSHVCLLIIHIITDEKKRAKDFYMS